MFRDFILTEELLPGTKPLQPQATEVMSSPESSFLSSFILCPLGICYHSDRDTLLYVITEAELSVGGGGPLSGL